MGACPTIKGTGTDPKKLGLPTCKYHGHIGCLIAGDDIKMAKSLMPGDLAIIRIILDLFIVQIPTFWTILSVHRGNSLEMDEYAIQITQPGF